MRVTTATDYKRTPRTASSERSELVVVPAIAALLVFIFWLDRVTGSAPVQHLYYIPIIIAAVRFGLWPGVGTSAIAIILYHLGGELRAAHYSEGDIVKIALFIGVGVIAARLADDSKRFRHLAMTDDLTGLHNLRSFEKHLLAMVTETSRRMRPLAMLVADVDNLKKLNDRHGHLAGAEAVRAVGHIIANTLPHAAVACRYGGDEFAILLPGYDVTRAALWGEELRVTVERATPFLAGHSWPEGTLSISVGAACLEAAEAAGASSAMQGENLFKAADIAMYRAKASGKGRICAWPEGPAWARERVHERD